ncbi:MAG TPA: hypothetical protein DCS87_14860 [Rheinheimera sp.]|nr:hypothetical protein [Rheinheimera sp.]
MKLKALLLTSCMLLQPSLANSQEVTAAVAASDPSLLVIEFGPKVQIFTEAQRLSVILQLLPNTADIYWPTAQLYNAKAPELAEVENSRQQLAEQLRLLTLRAADNALLSQQLMALRQQILSWRLAKPLHEIIRPASVETSVQFNPNIGPGHYVLSGARRSNAVTFLGLGGEFFAQYQGGAPAYQYLDALERNRLALPEYFYVARANMPLQTIPVASWNRSEQPLQPGDLVFVPLPDDVLSDYGETFNMQLLELVRYRVMP